jgi:hypothetical protein
MPPHWSPLPAMNNAAAVECASTLLNIRLAAQGGRLYHMNACTLARVKVVKRPHHHEAADCCHCQWDRHASHAVRPGGLGERSVNVSRRQASQQGSQAFQTVKLYRSLCCGRTHLPVRCTKPRCACCDCHHFCVSWNLCRTSVEGLGWLKFPPASIATAGHQAAAAPGCHTTNSLQSVE